MSRYSGNGSVYELLSEAKDMAYDENRVRLCQKAARLADLNKDIDAGYDARYQLCYSATFAQKDEIAFESFAWMVSVYDREPGRFDFYNLLWVYKYILDSAYEFSQLSTGKINELLDDYKQRLKINGFSDRNYYYFRYLLQLYMGNLSKVSRQDILDLLKLRRDMLSDCHACEISSAVSMLSVLGEFESAVKIAEPLLVQKLSCAEEPYRAYASLLYAFVALGKYDEAEDCYKKCSRQVRKHKLLLEPMSQLIQYNAIVGKYVRAVNMVEKYFDQLMNQAGCCVNFQASMSCQYLMSRLSEKKKTIKLRLPRSFVHFNESGQYDVNELETFFANRTTSFAKQLDLRNGNSFYSDIIPGKMHL